MDADSGGSRGNQHRPLPSIDDRSNRRAGILPRPQAGLISKANSIPPGPLSDPCTPATSGGEKASGSQGLLLIQSPRARGVQIG